MTRNAWSIAPYVTCPICSFENIAIAVADMHVVGIGIICMAENCGAALTLQIEKTNRSWMWSGFKLDEETVDQ